MCIFVDVLDRGKKKSAFPKYLIACLVFWEGIDCFKGDC